MNGSHARPIYNTYRFEAAVRRAAWGRFAERIAMLVARYRARQTVRQLAALSDQELRDIGLLRAEIGEAAAKSATAR